MSSLRVPNLPLMNDLQEEARVPGMNPQGHGFNPLPWAFSVWSLHVIPVHVRPIRNSELSVAVYMSKCEWANGKCLFVFLCNLSRVKLCPTPNCWARHQQTPAILSAGVSGYRRCM